MQSRRPHFLTKLGAAPDTALHRRDVRAVRPRERRAGAGVDAEHARAGRGREMERASVVRDHEVALECQRRKLLEPGPAAEVKEPDRSEMTLQSVERADDRAPTPPPPDSRRTRQPPGDRSRQSAQAAIAW